MLELILFVNLTLLMLKPRESMTECCEAEGHMVSKPCEMMASVRVSLFGFWIAVLACLLLAEMF